MRAVVAIVIAACGAVLGWFWYQPECAGGFIADSEMACVGIPGFDRQFCARAFARPEEAIFRAGNVYASQSDCQLRHPVCIEYPGVHGYTPKPSGFCLVRGADGALASMTPVYGPRK